MGSNIQVGAPDGQASLLPLSKVQQIEQVQGVRTAFAGYRFSAKPGGVSISFGAPDYITSWDPSENDYSPIKLAVAQGRNLDTGARAEVVLGSSLATEFKKSVGDTIDLPVRPKDANPDFVNHPFKVVGIWQTTNRAPWPA